MSRVGKFEKVSYDRFAADIKSNIGISDEECIEHYTNIKIPTRATKGSAGYDFKAPFSFELKPGETIKIPTGVRVKISDGWFLMCVPRSSLGFKYRAQLDNTCGIIDSDFYYSDNEGHIFIKLTNDGKEGKTIKVDEGQGFVQGIFLPYGITYDDDTVEERNGGIGSTDK